jgi:hypothetical protein
MSVKAKFLCTLKQTNSAGETRVGFTAVYSSDPNSENARYWKATPAGSVDLQILNEAAAEQFEQGKEYFLEFTLAK